MPSPAWPLATATATIGMPSHRTVIVAYNPLFLPAFFPILLGSLIMLATALMPFFSADGRERAIGIYDRFGLGAPTLFAVTVALYAVVLFSWTTLFLDVHGWITISVTRGAGTRDLGFYVAAFGYETAKAIPVIDLTDAFQWKAPYSHSGFTVGVLLIVFRITVLAPIIGFYGAYWTYMRKRRQAGSTQEEEPADKKEDEKEEMIMDISAVAGQVGMDGAG